MLRPYTVNFYTLIPTRPSQSVPPRCILFFLKLCGKKSEKNKSTTNGAKYAYQIFKETMILTFD
jgi:hypothetical protein